MVFFRPILQMLIFLYLRYQYSRTLNKWKKNLHNDCDQMWEHLPQEAVGSSSLDIVRPQLGKTLSNLTGLESWLCSEQESGPDEVQRLLLP